MKTNTTRLVPVLVKSALIAALYTVLTFVSAPLSFGAVQFRLSEALGILPLFSPIAISGLTLGCFLSNLIGLLSGLNPLGAIDMLVGTVATLLAAVCCYCIGKYRSRLVQVLFAPLPSVVINAVLIGLELTLVFSSRFVWVMFLTNAVWILLGQAVVCYGLGVPLLLQLYKNDNYQRMFKC